MDTYVFMGSFKMCLCFGGGKIVLEGFTNADMIGEIDYKESTSGYLFTFAGELYHGSLSCRNVWPCLP